MKPKLIKIPNTDTYVNPQYVTSIEPYECHTNKGLVQCRVWVVGAAGYGTYSVATTARVADVVKVFNEQ